MIKTNLRIGLRNILKNKGFFALNAGGLIVGLTAVLLISLWVHSELSYNKSFSNYNKIASVMQNLTFGDEIRSYTGQPLQLAPVLRDEYGNHFEYVVTSSRMNSIDIAYNENIVIATGRFAEPDLTNMLDVKMIAGRKDALHDISSILLSKSIAATIFGVEDPMGKSFNLSPKMEVKVAGIYEDLPKNSNFEGLDFIAPWELLKKSQGYESRLGWGNYWFNVYAQLKEESSLAEVSGLIKNVRKEHYTTSDRESELFLFPMAKWHLHSNFENGISTGGRIEYVVIFSIIGIFILLLACINFMNLSTAHALKRSKEVGVRKTLGSSQKQLIFQFFTESFIIILFAFCVALLATFLLLPQFNTITLKEVSIPFGEPSFWGVSFVLVGITAVLSSLYPSFYLSAFKPVKVLKRLRNTNKGAVTLRKTLIVVQFVISGILIIGTLTVVGQINHVKNRPLGFNKDMLISIPINNGRV